MKTITRTRITRRFIQFVLGFIVLGAVTSTMPGMSVAGPTTGTANIVSMGSEIEGYGQLAIGDVMRNYLLIFGLSHTNDFAMIPTGEILLDTPLVARVGAAYSWTSGIGSFAGHVYSEPVLTWFAPNSSSMSVLVLGTFTPSARLDHLSPVNILETISYTDTGGTVSMSATIGGPSNVPEPPMGWILLAFVVSYVLFSSWSGYQKNITRKTDRDYGRIAVAV